MTSLLIYRTHTSPLFTVDFYFLKFHMEDVSLKSTDNLGNVLFCVICILKRIEK